MASNTNTTNAAAAAAAIVDGGRTLVLYAYHECAPAAENLRFFCRHGIVPDASKARYVIVVNGDEFSLGDDVPPFENVRVLRRANVGFDFGAWRDALDDEDARGQGGLNGLRAYDAFVMMNGSVRGPFWREPADAARSWLGAFRALLDGRVRWAGTTINAWPAPHVQSMFVACDRVGLDAVRAAGVFDAALAAVTKMDVINECEIGSSRAVMAAGHEIGSVLPWYRGVRYAPVAATSPFTPLALPPPSTSPESASSPPAPPPLTAPSLDARVRRVCAAAAVDGGASGFDLYFARRYLEHFDVEPLDVVFFKTNRGVSSHSLIKYTTLADECTRGVGAADRLFDARARRALDAIKSPSVPSAWKGHVEFAAWLVARFDARIVVDLGVDYGHSTLAWSLSGRAEVTGIDWFCGDEHAGVRDTMADVQRWLATMRADHGYADNARLLRSSFDDAARAWPSSKRIDVLHIDGLHTAEAIRDDYAAWRNKVAPGGLIVFHDVASFPATVGAFFDALPLPKLRFEHSAGLGVACADAAKIDVIRREWRDALVDVDSEHMHHRTYDLRIQKRCM